MQTGVPNFHNLSLVITWDACPLPLCVLSFIISDFILIIMAVWIVVLTRFEDAIKAE